MNLVGPENENILNQTKSLVEQNHPLRKALSNAKDLIFPPFVPESDLQGVDKRIAVTGWKEICSLAIYYIGAVAFSVGVSGQADIPAELTLSLGVITAIALPSTVYSAEQRSKYYEIRNRLIREKDLQQTEIAITKTPISLPGQPPVSISLVEQYADQLGREDIDLKQKSAAFGFLKGLRDRIDQRIGLWRPSQGHIAPSSKFPEPFSGPNYKKDGKA